MVVVECYRRIRPPFLAGQGLSLVQALGAGSLGVRIRR